MLSPPFRILVLSLAVAASSSSCLSTSVTGPSGPEVDAQRARIRAEPPGDYHVGRRYVTQKTRFWGYLRRPRQPWDTAKLVMMNESIKRTPDRLPELPEGADRAFGYDHNYEYRIWGSYTGRTIYDPNSNLFLPEFRLEDYELISQSPGFLFDPRDTYDPKVLPRRRP